MDEQFSHGERAEALFYRGYNCAQAVFGAFAQDMGMDMDAAMRLASSMGGGIGRLREVCGAFSAICLVAGVLWGYDDPDDPEAKPRHYALIQQLAERFRERNGALLCRDLLGEEKGRDTDPRHPDARDARFYASRPCVRICRAAAEIMEEQMRQRGVR